MIDINLYQDRATKVKKYKGPDELYLLAKLTEESGEIAKEIRKNFDGEENQKDMTSELGDLMWCLAAIAKHYGISLEEIIIGNLVKLEERNLL